MPAPEMYTVAQVAAHLQLSRSRVFELIKSGALPSCKIGKARRVSTDQLADYIASLSQSPAA